MKLETNQTVDEAAGVEPVIGGGSEAVPESGLVVPVEFGRLWTSSTPTDEFLRLIPHEFARRHLILSGGRKGDSELLMISDRTLPAPVFNVGVRLKRRVEPSVHPPETIAALIDRTYAEQQARQNSRSAASAMDEDKAESILELDGVIDVEADLNALVSSAEIDLLNTANKGPVIRLVDLLLFEALQRDASDVHIQPLSDRVLIRYRLDGVLHTARELPPSMLAAVVSRVKVMARLDVAEQRAPQDGRATVTLGGARFDSASGRARGATRRVDLRISTLPTTYGERIVMRILDTARSPHLLHFAALGMPQEVERVYQAQVSRSSGIVLATGPTGSGKTTTLYTTLAWITRTLAEDHDRAWGAGVAGEGGAGPASTPGHRPPGLGALTPPAFASPPPAPGGGAPRARASTCSLNIMTIEDPVEYDLAIAGLSISQTQLNAKKNVTFASGLKHILRQDPDVIMVGEVRDEETAKIAVQASLTGHLVLSTLHTNDAPSAVARLLDLGVEPFLASSSLAAVLAQRLVRKVHVPCQGKGCPACFGTGFQGRTGVFELLVLDDSLREMVARKASASELRAAATMKGMVTLRTAGEQLAASGITTLAEVAQAIEGVET